MPRKPKYRLQPILIVKDAEKRKSEIELARALSALEEEKKKLKKLEEERVALRIRIKERRKAHSEKVSAGETSIRDNEVFLNYLRKLKEDDEELERKINEQNERVRLAEERAKRARRAYIKACTELRMMEKHKELWEKKLQQALTAKENKELGELGNVLHGLNRPSAG